MEGRKGGGAPVPSPGAEPRRLTCPSCSHAVWYSARWHRSFTRWYLGRKFSWASALSLSRLWSSLLWGRERDPGLASALEERVACPRGWCHHERAGPAWPCLLTIRRLKKWGFLQETSQIACVGNKRALCRQHRTRGLPTQILCQPQDSGCALVSEAVGVSAGTVERDGDNSSPLPPRQ